MTAIDDTLERVRSALPADLDMPDEAWLRQSGPFKSIEQFTTSSFKSMRELLRYSNIDASSRVLDYGCGLARLAIPLSGYLDADSGSYTGVDTDRECIDRNRQAFGALPHFEFEHVNLYSTMYNRRGRKGYRSLKRKRLGEPFDLAILFSVFTHILPENADDLLGFLRSQLVSGGQIFATWFLLNPSTEEAIADGMSHRPFPFTHGSTRIDNADIPEGAVAYQEAEVMDRLARAGFGPVRVHYGKWRGNLDSWVWQDIVVAEVR